jgi:hypothetical protein
MLSGMYGGGGRGAEGQWRFQPVLAQEWAEHAHEPSMMNSRGGRGGGRGGRSWHGARSSWEVGYGEGSIPVGGPAHGGRGLGRGGYAGRGISDRSHDPA